MCSAAELRVRFVRKHRFRRAGLALSSLARRGSHASAAYFFSASGSKLAVTFSNSGSIFGMSAMGLVPTIA